MLFFFLIGRVLSSQESQESDDGNDGGLEWTICRVRSQPGQSAAAASRTVPPSQWEVDAYNELCFLKKRRASIPGTALVRHWLADFAGNNFSSHEFDPLQDFPPIGMRNRYPDISEDPDYYTLWYTTKIDLPTTTRNGHLTLHGVNYQPVVYLDGQRVHTLGPDVGGMFLRRPFGLGAWKASDSKTQVTLEILVLPPPYLGRPVLLNATGINSTNLKLEDAQGV